MLGQLFMLLSFTLLVDKASSDTPANCTYEDIQGTWTFYEGERGFGSEIDCNAQDPGN